MDDLLHIKIAMIMKNMMSRIETETELPSQWAQMMVHFNPTFRHPQPLIQSFLHEHDMRAKIELGAGGLEVRIASSGLPFQPHSSGGNIRFFHVEI